MYSAAYAGGKAASHGAAQDIQAGGVCPPAGNSPARYALTMGLTNNGVSKAVRRALESITLTEYLPADIREEFRLIPYADALEKIISPRVRRN